MENCWNPSPPPEWQGKEHLLHADCIDGTAYSKVWVLRTLQELYKREAVKAIERGDEDEYEEEEVKRESGDEEDESRSGEDDFQTQLCRLWDMSMIGNVAAFLMENRTVNILMDVIYKSKTSRIIEICVGILGNMACESPICQSMSENLDLIDMSLALLSAEDTGVLTEATRLIATSLRTEEARSAWLAPIKASPVAPDSIRFILSSSVNLTLLKSTAVLLDAILDSDEEMCRAWATQDMVEAVLEAVKQSSAEMEEHPPSMKPEDTTLATFLHVFQLFSTCTDGVRALVQSAEDLQAPLLSYLDQVCQYEIVDVELSIDCLSSTLCVLHILYSSSPVVRENLMSNCHFHRYLTKILEPLYPATHEILTTDTGDPVVEGLDLSTKDAAAFRDRMSRESEEESTSRKRKASRAAEQLQADSEKGNGDSVVSKRRPSEAAEHHQADSKKDEEHHQADSKKDEEESDPRERKFSACAEYLRSGSDGAKREVVVETAVGSRNKKAKDSSEVQPGGTKEGRESEAEEESPEKKREKTRLQFLFDIIQDILAEMVNSYYEEMKTLKWNQEEGENTYPQAEPLFLPVLHFMNHKFSRKRLVYMLLTLEPVTSEVMETFTHPIQILLELASKFRLIRLMVVINDFSSARGLSFSISSEGNGDEAQKEAQVSKSS